MGLVPSLDLRGNRVLIFIVAYNAETTIEKVLSRIPSSLHQEDVEVLIGGTDPGVADGAVAARRRGDAGVVGEIAARHAEIEVAARRIDRLAAAHPF